MGRKTETFLARLRNRGQITIPPEYIESLGADEGDLLRIQASIERRRNKNEDEDKKEEH
jgi:bifunctional DNA-binding transcriptional regulator/antitoxin component of YhaV-PrlF toxin-antitoxin module